MTDLPISGELQLSIDQASKRAVREEIEEISAPPVELQVDRGSDLGGPGGQIGNSTTGNIDQQLSTQLELDRERNEYLEEIADATSSGSGLGGNVRGRRRGGDGGGGGGLGGLLGLLAGGAGLLAGGALALDDPDPVPVEDPGDVGYGGPKPIPVEEPGDVGYGGPEQLGVEDPGKVDTTVTVETTTGDTTGTDSGKPDTSPVVDPNQEPLELGPGAPRSTDMDGFDFEEQSTQSGGEGLLPALGGLAAGGAAALASTGSKLLSGLTAPKPGGAVGGTGIGFPAIGPMLAEPFVGDLDKNAGGRGSVGGGRMAAAGAPLMMTTASGMPLGRDNQTKQEAPARQQTQKQEIRFNPTYELNAKELERQVQDDLKELRRRLDDLESSIIG